MQDTLDLRVAPHEPVHVAATASVREGHVKRHRRVVVFLSATASPASNSTAHHHIICVRKGVRKGVGRENDQHRATSTPSSSRASGTMSRRRRGLPHFLGLSQARASPYNIQTVAGAESLLRPKVPATGRHFESLLFSTHIARTSSSKPSQNRVIASAMARSVFATIVSLSTADRLPPRARQETLAPCS